MEKSDKPEKRKNKFIDKKIFNVPFEFVKNKENISITTNKTNKDDIIKQAFKFHSQGNISEAEKYYQAFIEEGGTDYRVFSNYGVLLKDIGKLKDAEISIRKAIQLKPDSADLHYNLGLILEELGKLKRAEISIRNAVELNPNLAIGYSKLASILRDLGQLKEAEISTRKAVELNPKDKTFQNNLISLLTIYKPENTDLNKLYIINEEFKKIDLAIDENNFISNNQAIKIYNDGLEIYRKYNLNLETSLLQIYKKNGTKLNCKRHMFLFDQHKIIPEFCFECYKVQVEVDSIIELIKLFLVFNSLQLENRNTRKCMIELRNNISGFYKGLIYCLGLNEALEISKLVNLKIQNNIRVDLESKVKRGCSEFPIEYPEYKEIRISGDQPMSYNKQWKSIENEYDKDNKEWSKEFKSIEGFNLNNFLIMRNWIAYAIKIGDQSVNKITHERIIGPKRFEKLNRQILT